jgi:hypothetical protein
MAQRLLPDAPPASLADCTLVRTHLDAFVDGELPRYDVHDRPLAPLVRGHLDVCAPCSRLAQQVRALRAALRAVGARERETVRASESLRRRATMILSSR